MGSSDHDHQCPVFRPTKAEFSQPFCAYVRKMLKKHPDLPMFKVVPPAGWSPRNGKPFPKLNKVNINCPIKQLVFGTRGSYRCILLEQKPLTAAEFKAIADDQDHAPPRPRVTGEAEGKGARRTGRQEEGEEGETVLERPFWSSVTINPPLYGADTPQSFFDEKLPYGWNLRHLQGCLLHKYDVPDIAGVTTPMTYFGMWKSFFSWHVEDADLYSINYLHFGAPKVWYCVAPSHRSKFERMAASLFPELAAACPSFMRHKDILLSPSLLRTYGVEYMQAKQETNEFIVLNAGAYHAGYNTGFNCAEAVNFATEDWLEIGKAVQRCKCGALNDGVRISMRTFGLSDSSDSDSDSDDEDEDNSSDEDTSSADPDSDSQAASSEEEEEEERQRLPKGSARAAAAAAALRVKGKQPHKQDQAAGAKRGGAQAAGPAPASKLDQRSSSDAAQVASGSGRRSTRTAQRAAESAAKLRSTRTTAEARAKLAVAAGRIRKRPAEATARASKRPRHQQQQEEEDEEEEEHMAIGAAQQEGAAAGGGGKAPPSEEPPQPPQVIVGEERGNKYFYMVQVIKGAKGKKKGHLVMRWLKEDQDGLFRPSSTLWEEAAGALVPIRTQWVPGTSKKAGGYRLLTLRSRILDTELVD